MYSFLFRKTLLSLCIIPLALMLTLPATADEVNKGRIPSDHLVKSCKVLPWGVSVWDLDEATASLKAKEKVIWVDTRPESFFKKGTVRNASLMPYNKTGAKGNMLTPEKLQALIEKNGLDKSSAKVAFFCQGPKCHRSYNAAYVAVAEWGYSPENVIWFRDGYPNLFKGIKSDAKLRRRAKAYISQEGMSQL